MEERLRFIARLLDGEKMAGLCREFGISRKTGYKIYKRYKDCGIDGLTDDGKHQAHGVDVLSHAQAVQRAIEWCSKPVQLAARRLTIADVIEAYLRHYESKTRDQTKSQVLVARNRIIPALGHGNVNLLMRDPAQAWFDGFFS